MFRADGPFRTNVGAAALQVFSKGDEYLTTLEDGTMISGWDTGLAGLRKGDRAIIRCVSALLFCYVPSISHRNCAQHSRRRSRGPPGSHAFFRRGVAVAVAWRGLVCLHQYA